MNEKLKRLFVTMSGVGALLIALPVMYRIYKGDVFNPITYLLWAGFSVLCTYVLVRDKQGGHVMMIGYCISDLAIGLYALYKGNAATIGTFDCFVVGLVVFCALVYLRCAARHDLRLSIITNATACIIAGLPLLWNSIKNPQQMSFMVCFAYLAVSGFGYYGEKSFNGKLIPGVSIVYWVICIGGMAINTWG